MSAPPVDLDILKTECETLQRVVMKLKSNLNQTMVRMGLDATDTLATVEPETNPLETDRDALKAKRDALKLTINFLKSRYIRVMVLGGDCAREIPDIADGSSYQDHIEGFEILTTDQDREDIISYAGTPTMMEEENEV